MRAWHLHATSRVALALALLLPGVLGPAPSVAAGAAPGSQSETGASVSGQAMCGDRVLPGARVEFLSGAVVVASLTADRNGAYHLTGLAPRATYSVRYSDVKASVTCGGPFNTADALDASVPRLGACPERDRKNLSWEQAAPLSSGQAVTDSLCQPNQSRWFKMAVAPAQIVTVELGKAPGEYRVALFKDLRSVAADLHQKAGDIASGKVEPTLLDAGMGTAAAAPWESSPWESSPWESSPWESSFVALGVLALGILAVRFACVFGGSSTRFARRFGARTDRAQHLGELRRVLHTGLQQRYQCRPGPTVRNFGTQRRYVWWHQ